MVNAEPKKKTKPAAGTEAAGASGSTAVAAPGGAERVSASAKPKIRIAAVTSCATGIAHTYMAADALTQAAEKRPDVELIVEPQGSAGGDRLEQSFIDFADAVIFAHDVAVRDKDRFAGKPVVDSPVKRGANEPDAMIDETIAAAKNPNAPRVATVGGAERSEESHNEKAGRSGCRPRS